MTRRKRGPVGRLGMDLEAPVRILDLTEQEKDGVNFLSKGPLSAM